jgi:hypothetical protein
MMMITGILKNKKSFVKKIQMKKPTLIPFGDTKTMQRVNKKMRISKSGSMLKLKIETLETQT